MPVTADLPPPGEAALLLDLDGTLLDIAPTPDSVVVPPDLADSLRRLRRHLGDALAVITGRPVAQIEALLGDAPYAIAGEHGGALRAAPGAEISRAGLPDPPVHWVIEAARIADEHPGALLEHKLRGFVLHFRAVPAFGPALHLAAKELIAAHADRFLLMPAHMAWEVRPRGADKGSAVAMLMSLAPFAGRRPIFIGDDVTDEDAIVAARAAGGVGLRVDEAFGTPQDVRDWLRSSADLLDAGQARWAA